MKIKFLIASSAEALASSIAGRPSATVEAEYGDHCVEGTLCTMAHHGSRAGQPAPCSYPNGVGAGVEVVGLSHLDLDALGGCMAILGSKPQIPGFWELAEFVDLSGPHKLGEAGATSQNVRRLAAFWAWSRQNRVAPPRDGSVADVTDQVTSAAEVLQRILRDDPALLDAGDAFVAAEDELNKLSFVEAHKGVVVRVSGQFVNHLYTSPFGEVCESVIRFDPVTGSLTVSFADAPTGRTAVEIVQGLWGPDAGGHASIAGSPRGRRMTLADLVAVTQAVRKG